MSTEASLAGKRIAMFVEDEFEDRELTGPLESLRAAGATVTLVGPTRGASFRGKRGQATVTADLAEQWRRASNSVALNLAEGASRRGAKEFRRFADIARGSLHEVEAIIDLILAMEYFQPAQLQDVIAARDECARTVYGLLRKFSEAASTS